VTVTVTGLGGAASAIGLTDRSFLPRDAMLARVLAMVMCLSVSVTSRFVLCKGMDGSSWFLAGRLLSTSITLYFKEIPSLSTKIRVLPSGTFS